MKNLIKNNLFLMFIFVSTIAASKSTWLGLYELKKPESLKN